MNKLRKEQNFTKQHIEFEEEQRRPLRSSMVGNRCSSLGLNSNNPLLSDEVLLDYYADLIVRAYLNKIKNERTKSQKQ